MEKLTAKKKGTIIRLYLSGFSYDEIATKCGVSKGSVSNVIADLKAGRFPEAADVTEHVEMLRELSLELRRSGLTPGQSAAGLNILSRINDCGLDPSDIHRWPLILKAAGSEDEAQEFVRLVYSIQEVQKNTGLSLENLDNKWHELERKVADLEPMAKQHQDYKKQIAELTRQRENLASLVVGLEEKYKLLNPIVKDLGKREQDLLRRTKDMETRAEKAEAMLATLDKERKSLTELGLSLEALAEFSQRIEPVARLHNITPAELRDRLLSELESLEQGLSLETLIHDRQLELEKKEKAIALAKQDSESLKAVVFSLKQEKASLEVSIKNTREKVSQEIAKIIPVAQDTIDRLVKELRRGYSEAIAEVHRLGDEALEVGIKIGRFEEILQTNQWLRELLILAQGEGRIEGKRVRVIVLKILRSIGPWLKENKVNEWEYSTLSLAIDNLIKELEKWKA